MVVTRFKRPNIDIVVLVTHPEVYTGKYLVFENEDQTRSRSRHPSRWILDSVGRVCQVYDFSICII